MKIRTKFLTMLVAIALVLTSINPVTVTAKAKAYKTKTVTVASGERKKVYTNTMVKKVTKISKNKEFTVKKLSSEKGFCLTGTDIGKKQTVKVTYYGGNTQKFNIKTQTNYLDKIVAELKPLVDDPDKGLPIVVAQWEKKWQHGNANRAYSYKLCEMKCDENLTSSESTKTYTMDEVLRTYTTSQKKALVLEAYFRTHMTYSRADKGKYWNNRNSNTYFGKLYNGTFKGVCGDGATMAYDVCTKLGFKAKYVQCMEIDHGWCTVQATDNNGTNYWHGIYTTSYSYNMKNNLPVGNLTKKQLINYLFTPNKYQSAMRRTVAKRTVNSKKPTAPSATTNTAVACPKCSGCSGEIYHMGTASSPYATNIKISYGAYGIRMYVHNGDGVVRVFDENGNEYPEVAEAFQEYAAP